MKRTKRPFVLVVASVAFWGACTDKTQSDSFVDSDTDTDADVTTDDDGDGLSNSDEESLGSDPNVADSDGDGWDDGEEVDGNTSPVDAEDHPYTGGWAIGDCRDAVTSTGNEGGETAEDFALQDQFGDTVHLHSFCDRAVYLVGAAFW